MTIATIPPRAKRLRQAFASVAAQTLQPHAVVVEYDHDRTGAAATKNRALDKVTTEWVAPLDDDDLFLPHHLAALHAHALETGADVVYSLPRVIGPDGQEQPRAWDWGGGPEFDPELLQTKAYIQTTSLVRTEAALAVGGFAFITDRTGAVNDDHGFYLKLHTAGFRFAHLHEPTFIWNHHGYGTPGRPGNTSGQPSRW
ncbi:glycosyltransferase family A protein [Streptomyces sp. MMBL 11-1]|uniref:glycosyltransferase family A protein n=1 Tax=Streptomyces sp. MMBL 11-1 TaxID=3026420 RepID=UPI00235F319F|nr:glycosyltransferase family A protein [Streptomyces sp. MMBL 11-1]